TRGERVEVYTPAIRKEVHGIRGRRLPLVDEIEAVVHVVEEVRTAEAVERVHDAGGHERGGPAEATLVIAQAPPAAALERHAARSPARTVPDPGDLDDEVHGEERARRDELDLALEDGVLAKVLDDVPRELVLHGSVVRRLVSRP